MVSFELGKEPRKMFFILLRAWDKENILSPHEESNLRTTDSALRCHRDSTVHRSAESEGLRFDSSLSLSHARDKTKNIFLNSICFLKIFETRLCTLWCLPCPEWKTNDKKTI